jgi:hypothetical protein
VTKLKDQVALQYQRINAPCATCGAPAVNGCAKTNTLRIRAKCDRFLERIVSTRATLFIKDLIDTKKAAVN